MTIQNSITYFIIHLNILQLEYNTYFVVQIHTLSLEYMFCCSKTQTAVEYFICRCQHVTCHYEYLICRTEKSYLIMDHFPSEITQLLADQDPVAQNFTSLLVLVTSHKNKTST